MSTNEQEAKKWQDADAKDVTAESVAASRARAEEMKQRADEQYKGWKR